MNFFHSFSKPTLEKKRYCCTEPVNNSGWVAGGGQGQSCLVLAAPPPPAPFPKQIIYETYQVLS